jgi:hypothetical protein
MAFLCNRQPSEADPFAAGETARGIFGSIRSSKAVASEQRKGVLMNDSILDRIVDRRGVRS